MPRRELPPLFSDVIKRLPMPFSGFSGGKVLTKLRGNRPTNPFVKLLVDILVSILPFPLIAKLQATLFWPLYLRLQTMMGPVLALFIIFPVYNSGMLAAVLGLSLPILTPTAPENAPVAKNMVGPFLKLAKSWQTFRINLVGAYVPVILLILTTPSIMLLKTPPLPSFWNIYASGLFCLLCLDTTYYALHRMSHSVSKNPIIKWLNKSHRHHHSCDAQNMIPLDSIRLTMVELTLTVLGIMSGPMLMRLRGGFHPSITMTFYSYTVVQALIAHTSYFTLDSWSHVMHHQRSNTGYGSCGLWDYLLGTSRSRSVDLMYHMANGYRNRRKTKNKLSRREIDEAILTVDSTTRSYAPNEAVVHIGDPGECFFILESGSCKAIKPCVKDGSDIILKTYDEPGQYFGELALLRGEPRAATIRGGPAGCTLAEISSKDFSLLSELTSAFEEQAATYDDQDIQASPSASDAIVFSTLMPQEDYAPGQTIIKQGDVGNTMYILEEGNCVASIDGKEVFVYVNAGQYFGELALLNNEPRKASVVAGDLGATVAVVNRPLFNEMVEVTGDSMQKYANEMYGTPNSV
mmetsp:Transcript_25486/g.46098  ORF Transcript_25486/g.46098 Transcript_25486/m.46098 type:complete len:576 (-) Transcript_25486:137-1864(-)